MARARFEGSAAGRDEKAWWGVHVARYRFAVRYLSGGRVLDVACGTGYGLPVLATRASVVVGVDADLVTARRARTAVGNEVGVLAAEGARLPFRAETFDVVTSFETLEHLADRDRFLAELKRVLAPGGLLILSTPNATRTRPIDGRPRNPYHIHEYTPNELHSTLKRVFGDTQLLGQTLSPRFTVSPFWEDQEQLPPEIGPQARRMIWRLLRRLPSALADRLSQALWGHPVFPGEGDYDFSADTVAEAPVLVALCRTRGRA